jgi:hypothetical protein
MSFTSSVDIFCGIMEGLLERLLIRGVADPPTVAGELTSLLESCDGNFQLQVR